MSPQNKTKTIGFTSWTYVGCLLWLAEQETDCRYLGDPDSGRHPLSCPGNCWQGTGGVPRFPTLRRVCAHCGGGGEYSVVDCSYAYPRCKRTGPHIHECYECNGRGWRFEDSLEVLLEVTARFRPGFILWPHFGDDNYMTWVAQYQGTDFLAGNCRTPGEAAVLVLYKAIKGEGE